MSEISDLIGHFGVGELTLEELADRLAAREYREPSVYQRPPPGVGPDEWVREHLGCYPEEGTWQEVEAAKADGRLTADQYWFVQGRVREGEGKRSR